MGIYLLTGTTISEVITQSSTWTAPGAIFETVPFTFPEPVTLLAGNTYFLGMTRTDAAGNISNGMWGGTGDAPGIPVQRNNSFGRAATNNPGVGTVIATGAGPYAYGVQLG